MGQKGRGCEYKKATRGVLLAMGLFSYWLYQCQYPGCDTELYCCNMLPLKKLCELYLESLYYFYIWIYQSVQLLSRVQLFEIPWIAARQAFLPITNSWSLLKLMFIESVMPSSHLILCHPLFLLPPIPPSMRVFSNKSSLYMRWPKYWSFNFSISPSKEHPELISFRLDGWISLQFKSLLQHPSSKASIFWHSAFLTVQISHPYMTTGKTIAFTRWTFVGKVMSLLFNMLSRLVIAFLPRSKHLVILWLQSLSAVISSPRK